MPLRTRAILIGAAMAAVTLIWIFFVARPSQNVVSELRTQQEQTRAERQRLLARLAHLQALQRDEPRLRAELAKLTDALPDDPRLPDFILQVQESANLAGIPFLSISPSLPTAFTPPSAAAGGAASAALSSITVTIATQGDYFEIEDFIVRLERLRRAVRINSFTLAPGGTGQTATTGGPAPVAANASPTLAVTFQMQMFVTGPGPAAAPPAATPVPGASPAPGSSPSPSPTATPG